MRFYYNANMNICAKETPLVKGAIFFGYEGEGYEMIFDGGKVEEVIQ